MAPSLCVIFLSGWGVATQSKGNLFLSEDVKPFLGNLVSSYPVLPLESPPQDLDMTEVYGLIGGSGFDEDKEFCVTSLLSSHEIKQYKYAAADHYGLFTGALNGRCHDHYSNEEWKFSPYPPAASLRDVPELGMNEMFKDAENVLKESSDTVLFLGVGGITTLAAYKDKNVVIKNIVQTNKLLSGFIHKALLKNFRVLLVSDSGLAESFDEVTSKPEVSRTNSPLPCLLMHKDLDGVRASTSDFSSDGVLPSEIMGSLEDIAPTILGLMRIKAPELMAGKVLFKEMIDRTLYN